MRNTTSQGRRLARLTGLSILITASAIALAACSGQDAPATPSPAATATAATKGGAATGSSGALSAPTASKTTVKVAGTPAAGKGDRVVKAGDSVSVNYTGTLDDGTEFDSSKGRPPFEFTVGAGDVIPGFDKGVMGLAVGQTAQVHIPAEEAYGPVRSDLVLTFPASQAPAGLTVGQRVSLGNSSAVVTAVSAESVTVDANHPLAGKALNFNLELVAIK
jgi:peptidylprolyl isomerase